LEQPSTKGSKKKSPFFLSYYLTKINLVLIKDFKMPNLIKNIPNQILKNKLKTGIFFGLTAYWGILIVGTFITF